MTNCRLRRPAGCGSCSKNALTVRGSCLTNGSLMNGSSNSKNASLTNVNSTNGSSMNANSMNVNSMNANLTNVNSMSVTNLSCVLLGASEISFFKINADKILHFHFGTYRPVYQGDGGFRRGGTRCSVFKGRHRTVQRFLSAGTARRSVFGRRNKV